MDKKKLLKYAVDYLSKYDSSKKNLVEILKRKIFRLNILGLEKHKLLKEIDSILLKLEKNNLINDNRYTFSKISSDQNILQSPDLKNYDTPEFKKVPLNHPNIDKNLHKTPYKVPKTEKINNFTLENCQKVRRPRSLRKRPNLSRRETRWNQFHIRYLNNILEENA